MSKELSRIGRDIGSTLLGKSIPHLVITFYVVYYFTFMIQSQKNFASWRSSWFGPAFERVNAFVDFFEPFVLTLLFAYFFDSSSSTNILTRISLIIGVMIFGLVIDTAIQLSKFNPPNQQDLNIWDYTVLYARDRSRNLFNGTGQSALIFGIIIAYLAL